MNPEVTQYIEKLQPWQIEVCGELRKMISHTIPDVQERLQYGKPHYLKNGHYACVIHGAKEKISFMIFNAGELEEIKGFFKSTTSPDRKTATIIEGQKIDYEVVARLLGKASASL
ncbi:DUF1801 domain-containing protein [Dyadobacter sp. LHD-138]|uniref:DUF1801 domain-containing protein n=1 Tax=Dyadobacter sp. LHD-138 TaxID=3071413 RepID=UPI0027E10AE3|nr:DUF1801 domain-containing protein [Dyadobacter sp. LHD-138]MDQ6478117.1 DUF1801 domain-containing protein [Dyadobacter sp. LHD-138]